MKTQSIFLLFITFFARAFGHGAMQSPSSWVDAGGRIGMSSGQQCLAGCDQSVGNIDTCACLWFNNFTLITGSQTISWNSPLRTYFDLPNSSLDFSARNPWRAPGTAKVFSPCGIGGGNPNGCGAEGGNVCPGGGYGHGPNSLDFNFRNVKTTTWKAGAIVEAAWGIVANHGGGYSYRLCKVTGKRLTEECFQAGALKFYGSTQWVQYGNDETSRVSFPAVRTLQSGVEWTRNPIPACAGYDGGYLNLYPGCPKNATQFPPPAPGLFGFGTGIGSLGRVDFLFSIVDKLQLPNNLTQGKYVLSWRWDCEQTPQIWMSCANILIQ